jgi:hypothetical protein
VDASVFLFFFWLAKGCTARKTIQNPPSLVQGDGALSGEDSWEETGGSSLVGLAAEIAEDEARHARQQAQERRRRRSVVLSRGASSDALKSSGTTQTGTRPEAGGGADGVSSTSLSFEQQMKRKEAVGAEKRHLLRRKASCAALEERQQKRRGTAVFSLDDTSADRAHHIADNDISASLAGSALSPARSEDEESHGSRKSADAALRSPLSSRGAESPEASAPLGLQ